MHTNWTGDCLQTGKLSQYITNTKINSAFHPSKVGKLSRPTSLSTEVVEMGCIHLRRVTDNIACSHMAGDAS